MKQVFFLLFIAITISVFSACQQNQTQATTQKTDEPKTYSVQGVTPVKTSAKSPTDAYKQLYEAVHNKDIAKIKGLMSQNSLQFAEAPAAQQKKTVDEVLENGFIDGNLSPTFPQIRDERIKDNFGALEIQGPDGRWTDYAFILEDGGWKVAVGDMFKGTYQKPAPSKSELENKNPTLVPAPAANANNPTIPNDKKPTKMPEVSNANVKK